MSEYKLKIGITQGDTNGIGWEVILKTFTDSRMVELCTPIIYGSDAAANFYSKSIADFESIQFHFCESAEDAKRGRVNLVRCGGRDLAIEPGKASAESGKAAVSALKAAVADLKRGKLDAVVTAPINKESVQSDEWHYTGHTEFFAKEFEGEPMMIMCSDRLRVGLVTIHIPVSEVSANITKEKIVADLATLRQTLKEDFGVVEPRIAVLALNPHAGDGGLLGQEEQEIIKPAIVEAFEGGTLAFGPFPADGLFANGSYAKYDAVLAMYHDQGLPVLKYEGFGAAVNITLGLPIIRTSVDHGTALDLAGSGKIDTGSLQVALETAYQMAETRI